MQTIKPKAKRMRGVALWWIHHPKHSDCCIYDADLDRGLQRYHAKMNDKQVLRPEQSVLS